VEEVQHRVSVGGVVAVGQEDPNGGRLPQQVGVERVLLQPPGFRTTGCGQRRDEGEREEEQGEPAHKVNFGATRPFSWQKRGS
jgi:hypothetical protein